MFDRRTFLRTTLGGIAVAGAPAFGQQASPAPGTRPDTLFLTWRRDPTTTMIVQWLDQNGAGAVSFAELGGDAPWRAAPVKRHPYPMTDLQVHRAELDGLKPGTEYRFRLGDDPMIHRFRTMPAKATDAFQFVSGGDCDVNVHAVANNILAARQDPMFTLIGGDLGYDNGRQVDKSLGFIRNYSRHMVDSQGRLIPLVVCMGNHEVNNQIPGTGRDKAPFFFALHDGLFAERSYATLDFGDYLSLVLLDSGHMAPIGGEQAAWLDKALAERSERPHLFAANHIPAYPSYRNPDGNADKPGTGAQHREHWVPLFERYNVDVVLEHHDHTFKRTHPLLNGLPDKRGVLYLGDGSWGKLRVPNPPEARSYLAKTSGSYHMSLHRLEGDRRFHLAMEETGRVMDVCVSTKRPRRASGRGAG